MLCNVWYQDVDNRSALHAAAYFGCAEIIKLLLRKGARVNAKDNQWLTALHRACQHDHQVVFDSCCSFIILKLGSHVCHRPDISNSASEMTYVVSGRVLNATPCTSRNI